MQFVESLSQIQDTDRDIKVGDKVIFTNQNNIAFGVYEVFAISKDNDLWKYGRCIYLDKDSYWYPCFPDEIDVVENDGEWINVADVLPPIDTPIFCRMKFGETERIVRERMWDEEYREHMINQGYLLEWLPIKMQERK